VISTLFRNWRFRAAKPGFVPGEDIRAYLTGFDPVTGEGKARIGDTVLTVAGAAADQLDQLVDLRVESFDATRAVGRAAVRARR
jgi:hypothetical protein